MQNLHSLKKFKFIQALIQLPFVHTIWVYGSRARGDHRDRSDIDLSIDCPNASTEEWLQVIDIVDNKETLLKIDCVRFDELSNDNPLRVSIMRDGVILYQKGDYNG